MAIRFSVIAMLLGLLLFAKASWANSAGSLEYQFGEHTYKLTWKATQVMTGRYGSDTTKVLYSVHRDDKFIHPKTLDGGTAFGCHMTAPQEVMWQKLGQPQVGWILLLSSICGNTHSYRVVLVVPDGEQYISSQFTAKTEPIIEQSNPDEINIWSTYQEWGQQGTALSFYVPELRRISLKEQYVNLLCPALPSDVEEWARLPYRSLIGDFFAGLKTSNPKVMRSALNHYRDIDLEWMEMQGFPHSSDELHRLVDVVAASREMLMLLAHGEQWWMKPNDSCLGG